MKFHLRPLLFSLALPLFLVACAKGPNLSKLDREGQLNRYSDTYVSDCPTGYWLLDSTYYGEPAQYLYEYKHCRPYAFHIRKDGQLGWHTSGFMQSDGTHRWLAKDLVKVRDDRFDYQELLAKQDRKGTSPAEEAIAVAKLEGQHVGALRHKLNQTVQAKISVLMPEGI